MDLVTRIDLVQFREPFIVELIDRLQWPAIDDKGI